MANDVFANGREVSCKAADGKSICAFPDVCLSPPSPPAGPIPVPYPNTGLASDTTDGSKSVLISGKEAMLKDKSYFKKSTGDEAATKSLGMGVVTHQIQGKVYFTSWSMDVMFEGENVVRHLDLTTHNHGSMPANTPTWPYIDAMAMPQGGPCSQEKRKEKEACSGKNTKQQCRSKECREARRCMLLPYKPDKKKGQGGCCKGQTPHHLIEVHGFTPAGERASGERLKGFSKYDDKKAPCVCCDQSSRYSGDHGKFHAIQGMWERAHMVPVGARSQMGGDQGAWNYKTARDGGVAAHKSVFPDSDCRDACMEAQLDAYHSSVGAENDTPLRADRSPLKSRQKKLGEKILEFLGLGSGGPAAGGIPG